MTTTIQLCLASLEEICKLCTREIRLRRAKPLKALVDHSDYKLVSQYRWYAVYKGLNVYAATRLPSPDRRQLYMHHLIIPVVPPGRIRDHKDRSALNNTRGNLRITSKSVNAHNTHKTMGIDFHRGEYRVRIKIDYKEHLVGRFGTMEEAVQARKAALESFYKKAEQV